MKNILDLSAIMALGNFKPNTRMLAINVSIPNLTVARQEQFRSPQLPIQTEPPSDVGVE